MKTFWAIIKLHEDETAQELLSTMFSKEEFNPHNAILIQDQMAILEVFFEENPPKKIAEAIGGYSDVRCGFGEVSEDCLRKGGLSAEQVYPKKEEENIPPVQPADKAEETRHHEGENEGGSKAEDVPPAAEPIGEAEVEAPHDVDKSESTSSEEVTQPVAEPIDKVEEEPSHDVNESESSSSEEDTQPIAEPIDKVEEEPSQEMGESESTSSEEDTQPVAEPIGKSGCKKPRKAPEHILEIDIIARRCASYAQFASVIATWLELGKRKAYFVDLVQVAATVEKISWTPIEKEMSKKGYNNPFASRQRTSMEVTKKLTEMKIDCSFIALVEYVAKYKNFDFRSCIEENVKEIIFEMGPTDEVPELREKFEKILVEAVMTETDNVEDICKAVLGPETTDEDIWDTKMFFSDFVNGFLQKNGKEMTTAENFIKLFRETVFTGIVMW